MIPARLSVPPRIPTSGQHGCDGYLSMGNSGIQGRSLPEASSQPGVMDGAIELLKPPESAGGVGRIINIDSLLIVDVY